MGNVSIRYYTDRFIQYEGRYTGYMRNSFEMCNLELDDVIAHGSFWFVGRFAALTIDDLIPFKCDVSEDVRVARYDDVAFSNVRYHSGISVNFVEITIEKFLQELE